MFEYSMMDYLKKLKELKSTDKSKDAIRILESIDSNDNQKREALEDAKELIEAEITSNDIREILRIGLKDKYVQEYGPYILDFSDNFVIYEIEGDQVYKSNYSIENNKVVFGDAVKVMAKTIYEPIMEKKKPTSTIGGDYIQLIEAAVSEDGTIPIKIIQPGWGSSGYYSEEVLERDANIYKEGTKMYWDHPTVSDEIERPERSLNDLAGVLVSEGVYDAEGKQGAGIYAKAKVFGQFSENISEMAEHIGLSHIALGTAKVGEAEGQSGTIIESLNVAESVDFVTQEGAGGQIISLFESARNKTINKMPENKEELTQLKDSNISLTDEVMRLKEKLMLYYAHDFVAESLKDSRLPNVTIEKLTESLSKNPITDDKGEMDKIKYLESIKTAIKEEAEYLGKLTESGKVKGMGSAPEADEVDEKKVKETLTSSFEDLGLSENMVKLAVNGR